LAVDCAANFPITDTKQEKRLPPAIRKTLLAAGVLLSLTTLNAQAALITR
jgi:hypothetical protein